MVRRLVAAICLLLALPVAAVVERRAADRSGRILEPPRATEVSRALDPSKVDSPLARAAGAFLDRHGGFWTFDFDPRTGRVARVRGSGLPIDAAPPAAVDRASTLARIEPWLRRFIDEQRALLAPPSGRLIFDPSLSSIRSRGQSISMRYAWVIDDVPVEGAEVYVRIRHGRIVQFGSRFLGTIEVPTRPTIEADAARARLLDHSGDAEAAVFEGEPSLWLQPEELVTGELGYRLIWRLVYRIPGTIETWEGRVDAHDGTVVGFRDTNHYARARGGIHSRTVHESSEIDVAFPFLQVIEDGTPKITAADGAFTYSGGTVSSGLNGLYFDTFCVACESPEQPHVEVDRGLGLLDFGVGGRDEVGNGLSSAADRNAFYHINQVRRVAIGWLPQHPWLSEQGFPTVVNWIETCNAAFTGSGVNFFRGSALCNNAGMVSDVVYHEWGHGIDVNTRPGDIDISEGTADVVAMHMTHSSEFAPGFFSDGRPLRILDSDDGPFGVLTRDRVEAGACTFAGRLSPHCVGQLYGQAAWDLAQRLVARYGHHTGWRISERLLFTSLPDAEDWRPESAFSIYDAYLVADDDDGDLANGTPNAGDIHAAFDAHGIAGERLPTSPHCPRPAQPAVTLTPVCEGNELSWAPVERGVRYEVLRGELREQMPLFVLADVAAPTTSHTDQQVAPGQDYWYAVMAVDASGCESMIEAPFSARMPARPLLGVADLATDDTPRGNRSGFADPGEELDLILDLENLGEAAATAAVGTIESLTSGVTVIDPDATWGPVLPGEVRSSLTGPRFVVDESVACGALLQFRLWVDDGTGCAPTASAFSVRLGAPDDEGGYSCDPTPACFVGPDFAGIAEVVDGPSCGELDLHWGVATSNCQNAVLRFNVYRSSSPGFVPGAENRVAAGVVGDRYLDTVLEPNGTYHYAVRADDSRSGEDGNLVQLEAVAPGGEDLKPPVFAGLAGAIPGTACGDVRLDWLAAEESCSGPVTYEIHRSAEADFEPGAATLIGSSLDTVFVDVAPLSGVEYSYLVRAIDTRGNRESNMQRFRTSSTAIDALVVDQDFEGEAEGWAASEFDTATDGVWELGDPTATEFQPEDDASDRGTRCWMTGLGINASYNDVDAGATTLLSPSYDLATVEQPLLRYSRWFTNDRGAAPGEPSDALLVDASDDGGESWNRIETVGPGTPLDWVRVAHGLTGRIQSTSEVRFRFVAQDLGVGSLVEAGLDEFQLVDQGAGCRDCPAQVRPLRGLRLSHVADDIVLNWPARRTGGIRYAVYKLFGVGFEESLRIGTTAGGSFVHRGAARTPEPFSYRVTAINACGFESNLP